MSAVGVLAAYLLGAIPFGLLFSRWLTGKDPRQHGSGNIGATNALRTGGKVVGILTLSADIAKGALPVVAAVVLEAGDAIVAAVALAAFLGHIFPVYLAFKGGKGVATMYGVLIPWLPLTALLSFVIWFIVFRLTRYVSLASILAGLALPLLAWGLQASVYAIDLCAALSIIMVLRHHANIRRLLAGEEPKTGGQQGKAEAES